MVDLRKLELSLLECQWLRKAVQTQVAALVRARGKELDGSEIHVLRGREIESLNKLLLKL